TAVADRAKANQVSNPPMDGLMKLPWRPSFFEDRLVRFAHPLARLVDRGDEGLEVGKAGRGGDAALDAGGGPGGIELADDGKAHELGRVGIEAVGVDERLDLAGRKEPRRARLFDHASGRDVEDA